MTIDPSLRQRICIYWKKVDSTENTGVPSTQHINNYFHQRKTSSPKNLTVSVLNTSVFRVLGGDPEVFTTIHSTEVEGGNQRTVFI